MANQTPEYSKEFSIYEEETLRKIEVFRAARKSWLLTNERENTFTKENENLNKSDICNANFRVPFLRKLKPPPTSCPVYKSCRPLRYYTLKPRTSRPEHEGRRRSQKQRVRRYELVTPTVVEATTEKVTKAKHKDTSEYWTPRAGPCEEALSRLRAAHLQQGLIESCRCDDGREVTVVIKGICLCDKNSLNNVKLSKVCEKFGKFGVPPDEDFLKKRQEEEKALKDIENDESKTSIEKLLEEKLSDMEISTISSSRKLSISLRTDENSQTAISSEGKTPKKVDFTDEDIKRKLQPRKFSTLNDSELTIYKKLSVSEETVTNLHTPAPVKEDEIFEQSSKDSEPVKESNKLPLEKRFTSEVKGDPSNWSVKSLNLEKGDIQSLKKSSGLSDLIESINEPHPMENKINLMDPSEKNFSDEQKAHSLISDNASTSRVTVLDEKFKNLKHTYSKSASTVSLFKNYHQEPSTLGLTKEQMEVLKRNDKITITKQN